MRIPAGSPMRVSVTRTHYHLLRVFAIAEIVNSRSDD